LDRTFEALLLDMDGTLLSSVAAVERSWTRLAGEVGVPVPDFSTVHGVPAHALIDTMLADRPADERRAARARIDELELADVDGVEPLPGAAELLAALVPAGRCVIVTSSSTPLARARLAAVGLPVPLLVTADDVARGKPAPDPYLAGAALLGADPADCLAVEDARAGLESAAAAGATTLGLTTTHPDVRADVVVPDLSWVVATTGPEGVRVRRV
jgi:sugar-phosphatase